MQVTKAEYRDGKLELTTSAPEALKWLYSFKPDKEYDIVKHVEKRSRNANSYAWQLVTMLSKKLNIPTEEVYRHAIQNIGGQTTIVSMPVYAASDFKKAFLRGHIGRNVDVIGESDGKVDLLITYGSSDYDRKQMSQFIESLIQDCRAVGIETKDENYINSLLEEADGKY